ncbi:hypothetical protein LY76DRAFT_414849 [Colletotrichum caudatum]|nr:hypothetical protein LY76DRAFT_414849 [Colletotrichum caudatum]
MIDGLPLCLAPFAHSLASPSPFPFALACLERYLSSSSLSLCRDDTGRAPCRQLPLHLRVSQIHCSVTKQFTRPAMPLVLVYAQLWGREMPCVCCVSGKTHHWLLVAGLSRLHCVPIPWLASVSAAQRHLGRLWRRLRLSPTRIHRPNLEWTKTKFFSPLLYC